MISTAAQSVKAIKDSIRGWMVSGIHFGLTHSPTCISKLSKSQLSMIAQLFKEVKYSSEFRLALSFEISAR